jgi:hypothetical protein
LPSAGVVHDILAPRPLDTPGDLKDALPLAAHQREHFSSKPDAARYPMALAALDLDSRKWSAASGYGRILISDDEPLLR